MPDISTRHTVQLMIAKTFGQSLDSKLLQAISQPVQSSLLAGYVKNILCSSRKDLDDLCLSVLENLPEFNASVSKLFHRADRYSEEFYPPSKELFVALTQVRSGFLFDRFSSFWKAQWRVNCNNLRFNLSCSSYYLFILVNEPRVHSEPRENAESRWSICDSCQI
jgi:hypothetical protein